MPEIHVNSRLHMPVDPGTGPIGKPGNLEAARGQPLQDALRTVAQFAADHLPTTQVVHLSKQRPRETALKALRHYASQCEKTPQAADQHAVKLGQSLFIEFAARLQDPSIALDRKIEACRELAEGLGVCKSGEASNIQQALAGLQAPGVLATWTRTRTTMVEQHLQALVEREIRHSRPLETSDTMEVHDRGSVAQALQGQWRTHTIADRHASKELGHMLGDMATALLDLRVTPKAIAGVLSDTLVERARALLPKPDADGFSDYRQAAIDDLKALHKSEFAEELDTNAILEFNEDYTQVRLKPKEQLDTYFLSRAHAAGAISEGDLHRHSTEQAMDLESAFAAVAHLRRPLSTPLGPVSSNIEYATVQALMERAMQPVSPNPSDYKKRRALQW